MVCGITLFQDNISNQHREFLDRNLDFGSYFSLRDGLEIPVVTNNRKNPEYERVIWRKARHKCMNVQLGYKHNKLINKDIWSLKVYGSIHKYARNGDNSALFTAKDSETALDQLCKELELDKEKTKITSLEVGVNITLDFSIKEYFNLNLLCHKTVWFEKMKNNLGRMNIGWEAHYSHHVYKLYEKRSGILRYEIHWSDMQELREKYSLRFAMDLTESRIITIAEERLVSDWNMVVTMGGIKIVDGYFPDSLKVKDKAILGNYSNKTYCSHLRVLTQAAKADGNMREHSRLRKKHERERARFAELIHIYGDNVHGFIYNEIVRIISLSKQKCPILETGIKLKNATISNSHNRINRLINLKNKVEMRKEGKKCNNSIYKITDEDDGSISLGGNRLTELKNKLKSSDNIALKSHYPATGKKRSASLIRKVMIRANKKKHKMAKVLGISQYSIAV